ncbi:MAG: polysaccharide biosynthesis tyrosine autokinase [Candidatus Aminicenantales bacterium]|jgi:capsular exopolysaccharide synthesis family protein
MKDTNTKANRKEIDILEYWRIVIKRKWVLVTFASVLVVFVAVLSFTATPLYRATATILIDEPSASLVNIQDVLNSGGYYQTDYLGTYFNTQLKLLASRSLAERVAKKLDLGSRPEFRTARSSRTDPVQAVKGFLSLRWALPREKPAETPPEAGSPPATSYAFAVLDGLGIAPVPETRIVQVSYTSSQPVLAADIVNTLVEEFVRYSVETRYEATKQTSEFLSETISQLREDLKRKEEDLQKYGEEKKLLFLNDKESTVVNKFSDVNAAFTEAQIDRFKKEALYRELKDLNINALPESVTNPVIQALKASYSQAQSDYEEKGKFYRPDYPEMVKLKARLESSKNALQGEIRKAVGAAEADYRAALNKERSLQTLLDSQRTDVVRMNNNAILYRSLQIEVDNMRSLLSTLVSKQNEIQVSSQLGGLRTSNIKIVDRALVPGGPFTPNTRRNLMMALFLGLFGGLGLIFLVEYLDNTVKGPEDVEKLTGLPSLGIIPYLSVDGLKRKPSPYGNRPYSYGTEGETPGESMPDISEIELVNHLFPKFSIAEDYRTVRTSILFSHADSSPKTVCFTSPMPQEGKTATVSNMAISFAQLEGKVLLIDADLRKPRLHKVFQTRNLGGLSGFLTGKFAFDEAILKTSIENIWIIPSGPHPPNPAELLNSKRMRDLLARVKDRFDTVLLDTPPVLAVIDPVIVSSLADCTVLIVQAGKTTRRALGKAVDEVRKAKAEIIGVVFNEVKMGRQGLGTPYYHYYQYEYSASTEIPRADRKRGGPKGVAKEPTGPGPRSEE